jgi:hypothetical protein
MTERELWGSVIAQAVRDVLYPEVEFKDVPAIDAMKERVEALQWLESEETRRYSYRWACDMAEVDPGVARKAVSNFTLAALL